MILEDKLLIWKLKNRNPEAMRRIYEKYKNELLALAIVLCSDRVYAEDALHDVFISLARVAPKLNLTTDLKSYLASCVVNRLRNIQRAERKVTALVEVDFPSLKSDNPEDQAISVEQSRRINNALMQIPLEQREVVCLHIQSELKFRQIAKQLGVSINTIQSRYRYAINKLQTILNNEVEK
jgi:RNA polymerase sigma-70 factor (ECF subfamily)